MFGGLESIPNNSPHLRKSGSRSVVFDIGKNIYVCVYNMYLYAFPSICMAFQYDAIFP